MPSKEGIDMKKAYQNPELKVVLLGQADVIVTSDNSPGGDDDELPIY